MCEWKIEQCENWLTWSQNDRAERVTNKMSHMPCKTLRSVGRLCGVAATVTSRPAYFPWAENVITGLHGHFLTCDYMESTHMYVFTVTSQMGNVLKKRLRSVTSSGPVQCAGCESRQSTIPFHLQNHFWLLWFQQRHWDSFFSPSILSEFGKSPLINIIVKT